MGRLYILIATLATGAALSCTRSAAPHAALTPINATGLKDLVIKSGKPTIVNLWATWCEPCKTEMPMLRDFQKSENGREIDLILISADTAEDSEKAAQFLKQVGIQSPSYLLNQNAEEFGKSWAPTWSATLPATFITDSKGVLKTFWIGKTSQNQLKEKLVKALATSQAGPALQRHAK